MTAVIEVVDHMEVYRTMPDVIFPVPAVSFGDTTTMHIHVHKLGGGSPDQEYTGRWLCQLYHEGELIHSTAELETGMPHTFYMASGVYADFISDAGTGVPERLHERLSEWAYQVNETARHRII